MPWTDPPPPSARSGWRSNARLIGVAVILLLGVALIISYGDSIATVVRKLDLRILLVLLVPIAIGIVGNLFSSLLETGATGLFRWLRPWKDQPAPAYFWHVNQELERLGESIQHLRTESPPLTEADRAALIQTLQSTIKTQANRDFLEEIRANVRGGEVLAVVERSTEATLERFRQERTRLARRGNLNLFVGLLTTAAGLALLLTYAREQSTFNIPNNVQSAATRPQVGSVERSQPVVLSQPHDVGVYLVSFLPRLSMVILIEIFAYFFLNLYKASLVEVKFVQNEMTNVEARALGLTAAVIAGDRSATTSALQQFVSTDRNAPPYSADVAGARLPSPDKVLDIVKQLIGTMAAK